jgi:uncharacterized SAM-binding protein YcdF (DUF218 family)
MFFILSKLLLLFINPVNWMLVILLIAVFIAKSPKLKKRLYISVIFIFLLFGNRFIYNRLVMAWQTKPVTLHQQYEAGIVLGGFTNFDKHNNGYLNGSSDRFIETEKLYHQGIIKKIIVSGGSGSLDQSKPKEAGFVRQQFIEQGIPANDIYFENESRNTFENSKNCKLILDSLHFKAPIVLITSAMHMPRALNIFKKTGYEIIPYPSNYEEIDISFSIEDYLVPDLYTLSEWQKFLKEIVGNIIFKITGKG